MLNCSAFSTLVCVQILKKMELIHVEKNCEIFMNENEIAMEEKNEGEKFEGFQTLLNSLSKIDETLYLILKNCMNIESNGSLVVEFFLCCVLLCQW